jgi:hypothetical protein
MIEEDDRYEEILNETLYNTETPQIPASEDSVKKLFDMGYSCNEENIECIICCEEIKRGDIVIKLPCCSNILHRGEINTNHSETQNCTGIIKWFNEQSRGCPFCRREL